MKKSDIKFRYWDEGFQRFIYFQPFGDDFQDDLLWLFWDSDADPERYTGAIDRNNSEIYEGDILKIEYPAWSNSTPSFGKVIWDDKICAFAVEDNNCHPNNNWEVIGNIHQNPELLKK